MRAAHRLLRFAVFLLIAVAIAFAIYAYGKRHPADMPWTALDLSDPVGMFTGRKLAALGDEPAVCRALLERAGVRYVALPPRPGTQCGYVDGVRFGPGGAREIAFDPADVGVACPVAAALALWEWHVVQPAARRHFGARVVRIDHFGSFNCRRMYGRSGGSWSEHSTADAIDIAGFRLSDGKRVTVVGDWTGTPEQQAFLREVRDGACDLFSTVLSPDYNAAHRDHFHLDQAARGATSWRSCR